MNFEGKQQSLLTFRIGPVLCCAPSLPVRSIITPPKLTHPPGSGASQPGIFKHGSHIVKVIDLRQKFGVEEAEQTHPGNLIITIFEEGSYAFWVDQILDVFDFPSEGWGNLPAAIPRGVFSRTLLLNKKIHLYSEFEKLTKISNLGYLKHYIQQLKKQEPLLEDKNPTAHTKVKKDKGTPITKTATSKGDLETNKISSTQKKLPEIKKSEKVITTKITEINKQPIATSTPLNKKDTSQQTNPIKAKNTPVQQGKIEPKLTERKTTKISSPILQKAKNSASPIAHTSAYPKASIIKQVAAKKQINIPDSNTIESNSEGNSFFVILVSLFFILGLLFSGYYLLFTSVDSSKKKIIKEKIAISSKSYKKVEVADSMPLPSIEIQSHIEDVVEAEVTEIEVAETKLVEDYHANIIQQEDEIIITIHEPNTVPENNLEQTDIENIEVNKIKTISATPDIDKPVPQKIKNVITPKKTISEVIHTVAKGDTLWAIAKKYVNNPFLYPELARLSNIKNPHRIYPGNRVRIRFIKTNVE